MKEQNEILGYIYSLFGKTINNVQLVEKGIMNSIILKKLENNISTTRYYELYSEYYKKPTGQLLPEFNLLIPNKDIVLFEKFHELRDFLSHHFWWETKLELENRKSTNKIINELKGYISILGNLINYLNDFKNEFEKKHNLQVIEELNRELFYTTLKEIKKFRKILKNETVIDIFAYQQNEGNIIPVFKFKDDTYWSVAEIGLSQYFHKIHDSNKTFIDELREIFPIKQFNPRPKNISPWNYELSLKNKGLEIIISLKTDGEPFKWKIE